MKWVLCLRLGICILLILQLHLKILEVFHVLMTGINVTLFVWCSLGADCRKLELISAHFASFAFVSFVAQLRWLASFCHGMVDPWTHGLVATSASRNSIRNRNGRGHIHQPQTKAKRPPHCRAGRRVASGLASRKCPPGPLMQQLVIRTDRGTAPCARATMQGCVKPSLPVSWG